MKTLDTITVEGAAKGSKIELCQGDLTDLEDHEAVDLLVVSAFPDDYIPMPGSLIAALAAKGVWIDKLARHKSVDLRHNFSCWLSAAIESPAPGIRFGRVLCFEPLVRGKPPEVVGDIFRSLAPFLAGSPRIATVAMPLVATGYQGYSVAEIIVPLVEAAYNWMAAGMPLERLKIVAPTRERAAEAEPLFTVLKERFRRVNRAPAGRSDYDVFVSYSHEDSEAADVVERQLSREGVSTFVDRLTIEAGAAWQHKIFSTLDRCRRVFVLYSPTYVASRVCQEEFNIGWARSRKSAQNVLFPVYWKSAELPTYMELVHYHDCREARTDRLSDACRELGKQLTDTGRC